MGFWVLGSRSWVLGIEVLFLILRLIFDIAIAIEFEFLSLYYKFYKNEKNYYLIVYISFDFY